MGLISYSAYLWHQPLFAFARLRSLEIPSFTLMLSLSIFSIILAVFSWKFIENPFRNKELISKKNIFSLAATFGVFFCTLGITIDKTNFFEKQFLTELNDDLSETYSLLGFARDGRLDFVEKWQYGKCFYFGGNINSYTLFKKEQCLRKDPSKKNILLIGDSFAAQWYFALKNNFPEANIMQATASGCRPLLKSSGKKECIDLRKFIFNKFLPENSVDAIILAGRWKEDETKTHLKSTIKMLQQYSSDIYFIGPVLEYYDLLPRIILRNSIFGDQEDRELNLSNKHLDRWIMKDKFALSTAISSIVTETSSKYISVIDLICPNSQCSAFTPNKKLMTFDNAHLTVEGAEYLMLKIKENKLINFKHIE